MLDLYYIADATHFNPDGTDALEKAGSIDLDVYERLQRKGIIDSRFDYFSDFRWSAVLVKQLVEKASAGKFVHDTDVKQLLHILLPALDRGAGLVALAD